MSFYYRCRSDTRKAYRVPGYKMETKWKLRALVDPMRYFGEFPIDEFNRQDGVSYIYHTNHSFSVKCLRDNIKMKYYLFSPGPNRTFDNHAFFHLFALEKHEKSKI